MKYIFTSLLTILILNCFAQSPLSIAQSSIPIDHKGRYLDSLMKIIGDKRIVAIGEDTHGTAEFYELRSAITQRLIKEKGFTVLILENPHEDMMTLQRDLHKEKLDTLMRRHLFSIYQSKQMRDFLAWFKKYSRKRKQLRLAGCDDSFRELVAEALVKEAARYKNATLNQWCEEFLYRQTLSIKEFYTRYPALKPAKLPNEIAFGQATYQLLERIDSLCKAKKMDHPALKEWLFHAQTAYVFYERYVKKIPVSRDEIMGERINYYAADPTAKIIVWAHNGHIAKYAWLDNELGLMGATVLKKFPADYFAIGLSGGTGSYSYMKGRFINDDHQFTDTLFQASLHAPQPGSWNEWLLTNAPGNYLLDFSKLPAAGRNQWEQERLMKVLGYNKESETGKEYYKVSLSRMFDVLLFLKETNATEPVFGGSVPNNTSLKSPIR